MKTNGVTILLALIGGATALSSAVNAQQTSVCEQLTELAIPGVDLEITSARHVAAAAAPALPFGSAYSGIIPTHCRVDGVIERRVGANGVPYGIGFAIALPDEWNGRFLFQGGGGLNGTVGSPLGRAASGDTPALARGYAVISTDSGHEGAVFDGSFFADQEATLNFLYLAIGKVAVVGKAIIDAHYERSAQHAYYVGCSTGGREAMVMSQRYPSYFDGIVSGAPAMRTNYSNLGMRWVSVALNEAAVKDAQGRPIPGSALSDSDKQLVHDAILETCDVQDGLDDGMIFNTRSCDFNPAELICSGPKTDQCLRAGQADAIETAMSGARSASGYPIYAGYFYDTGITFSGQGLPGLLAGAPSPVGGPTPPTEQDVEAEAIAAATDPSALGNTHLWTNLSTFRDNGGKLLFYHGVSDPWFSALDTVEYYEKLGPSNGGTDAVNEWSRLFLVPGMGHCAGGAAVDQFDLLSAVVDWVENGVPPDSVTATGDTFPDRSRPLCPYPKYAHYTGRGDPEDVSSFECR